MELIFLRHGQTDWNVEGRLQGRTDVPLNETGIAGAKAAGKILAKYSFDAVYCSPLIRTRQTLEYALPGTEPIWDDRLLEWSFGALEGNKMPWEFFIPRWSFGYPSEDGVELIEDVVERARSFYRDVKERHPDGRILVVSHGGFSGALYGAYYGIPEGENLSKYCLPNSVPVLFREGQAPVVLKENDDD